MPLYSFRVPCQAVEPSAERGLDALGAIGRQVGGERRLNHKGLGHALAFREFGEPAGEFRRQAEGVFGPHAIAHSPRPSFGSIAAWRARPRACRRRMLARAISSSEFSSAKVNSVVGLAGAGAISSGARSSGSRRMPALAGSSEGGATTFAANSFITASGAGNRLQSSDVVTSFGLFSCGFGGADTRSVRRRSSK